MTTIKSVIKFILRLTLLTILVSVSSCNQSKIEVDGIVEKSGGVAGPSITVSNVDVVANQLVINGSNLETATSIRVTGPAGFDETFDIESQTTSQLIANSQSNLAMIVNGLFSLIVSNALGAATYTITFDLQDGQVTAAKLSGMGAAAGDVLTYDGASWGPAPLTGLSYEGTFDATSATDQTGATPASGHYYIVQTPGSIDPDGVTRANTYSTGDWAVYNGSTSNWDRVVGSSDVTSVNGQTGVVTLSWADFSKAGSLLSDIANVDVSGIAVGNILEWDGTNWVVTAPPTDTNTNAATICGAGQVLLGDGSCTALPSDTNAASLCAAGQYLDGDGTCQTVPSVVNAATLCSANQYLDGDGTCKAVPTDTDTDTNAGTLCAAGQYLDGDGTCQTVPSPTTSLSVGNITNAGGEYFAYAPNGVACANGEVLKWSTTNTRWECGSDAGAGGGDAASMRGEALDTALATNTTTDGQILVWSQTNSQWEVGAAPADTDTTYTAGTGIGLTGTTFNVDVGTGANQIVQLDGSGNLPAVDGSALTNVSASSINVDNVNSGAGLYFTYLPNNVACTAAQVLEWDNGNSRWVCGNKTVDTDTDTTYSAGTGLGLTGTTFDVDVGTGANQIVQLDGSGNLPAVDGSALTNVAAATATTASSADSVDVDNIANGAGLYFTYQPNNAACADGQVLKWSTTNTRWECGSDAGAGGGDAASMRGEALDTALATNTTTDGQILVWSQTNSQWEVGAAPADTDTTYTAGTGIGLTGTTFNVDVGTGANQIVQLDGSGNLPAVDGSALTNVSASSINVDNVNSGAGLYFTYLPNNVACTAAQVLEWDNGNSRWVCGNKTVDTDTDTTYSAGTGLGLTGTTFDVDVGTGANQIVQLDGSGNLPAVDGSALTNVAAATATTATSADSVDVDNIANGAGLYFTYQPNNAACADGQVLKWSTTNTRWECGSDAGAGGGDAASMRGEALDTALATNTTTDGQILVWSQTNSQWEVGAAPADTDTTYTAGTGIGLTGTTFNVDVGTGANQIVQLDGSGNLPAVDGSALTNVSASSINVDNVNSGAGLYFTYLPNNVACTAAQVLEWDNGNSRWVCGNKTVDTDTQNTIDTTTTLGTSDTVVPSQNAVKTYVDTAAGAITSSQWTTSGSDIYYNSGNVGVGVTAPNSALQVSATTGNLFNLDANTVSRFNVGFGGETSIFANSGTPALSLTNNSGTGDILNIETSKFVVDASGKVGIGTSTPGVGLDVNHGSAVTPATSGATSTAAFRVGQGGSAIVLDSGIISGSGSYLQSVVSTNLDNEQNLYLNPNGGNIGIGTTSPTAKLHVLEDTAASTSFKVGHSTHGTIVAGIDTNEPWFGTESNNDLRIVTNNAEKIRIEAAGNVGIGTGSPTQKLTVAGNINVTTGNDICIDGSGCLSSAVSGGGETNTASNLGAGANVFASKSAVDLQFRSIASADSSVTITQNTNDIDLAVSVAVDELTNGAGLYFGYTPNNTPCADGEVLEWLGASGWICGVKTVDTDTDTTYTAGAGIDATAIATDEVAINLATGTALSFAVGQLSSAWSLSGTDMSYNGGNVGIGVVAPENFVHFVNETTNNDAIHESINDTANSGSDYIFRRARGTFASKSAVQNNDKLGSLRYRGWDGTAYETGAQIEAFVEGTVADEQMATSLGFQTRDTTDNNPQERMRLSPEGFLGIGSTNPTAILTIQGVNEDIHHYSHSGSTTGAPDLKFYRSRGSAGSPTAIQDGDWLGSVRARGYDGDEYLFTTAMYIKADGAVLNDTIPTRFEFHTHSTTANDSREVMRIDSAGDVTMEGHLLLREVAAPALTANYGKVYVKADNKLYFMDDAGTEFDLLSPSGASVTGISTSADATAITIDVNERVGINTASPSESLEVTGTIKASAGTVWSSDGSTGTSRGLLIENYDDTANQNGVDIAAKLGGSEFQGLSWTQDTSWTGASTDADKDASLSFGVLKDNVATNPMTLTSDGYLGIGTSTPTTELHVVDTSGDTSEVVAIEKVRSGNAVYDILELKRTSSGSPNAGFGTSVSFTLQRGTAALSETGLISSFWEDDPTLLAGRDSAMTFNTTLDGTSAEKVRITSEGNVGIGTAEPTSTLHTVGLIRAENTTDNNNGVDTIRFSRARSSANPPLAGFGPRVSFHSEGFTDGSHTSMARISSAWEVNQTNDTTDRDASLIFSTTLDDTQSERMRIDSGGNVGIGTTSPSHKLDIVGSGTSTRVGISHTPNVDNVLEKFPGYSIDHYKNSIGGYGTISFASPNGALGSETANLNNDFLGGLVFKSYGDTEGFNAASIVGRADGTGTDSSTPGRLEFRVAASGSTTLETAMTVNSASNVGIGTTSPNEKLTVSGVLALSETTAPTQTANYGKLYVKSSDSKLYFMDDGGNEYALANGGTVGNFVTGSNWISNDGDNEGLYVTAAGNVGVGTSTASTLLHASQANVGAKTGMMVENTDATAGSFAELNATSGSNYLVNQVYSNGYAYSLTNAANGYDLGTQSAGPLIFRTNATERMRIDSAGNVGIGTSSPQNPFDVSAEVANDEIAEFTNYGDSTIIGIKRANGTKASPSGVLSGEVIGNIGFEGYGATGFGSNNSVALKARASENFTDTARGASFTISTTPVGSDSIVERVRVNHNGNVGIGTTDPSKKLHVQSTSDAPGILERVDTGANVLQLRRSYSAGAGSDNTTAQLQYALETETEGLFESMGNLRFTANDATAGTIDSTFQIINYNNGVSQIPFSVTPIGNVGIGTSTPDHKLVVENSVDVTSNGTNYMIGSSFTAKKKVSTGVTDSGYVIGSFAESLRNFQTTADSGTLSEIMGMRVHYGHYNDDATATPQTDNAYGVRVAPFSDTGSVTNTYDYFAAANSNSANVTNEYGVYIRGSTKTNYFAGNVGIGKNNPTEALDVDGKVISTGSIISGGSSGGVALTTNDGGGNANLAFNHSGEVPDQNGVAGRVTVNVDNIGTSAFMDFRLNHSVVNGVQNGLTNIMRLEKVGSDVRVGVNTSNPDQTFSVNGDASKSGGGSWLNFSDARLKTVNGDYGRGLASVRELNPIFFNYNDDNPLGIANEKEHVGFVAQEVEKVIPEAVIEMDSGYLQLNSDPILWAMLNSIKELDLIFGEQVNKNVAMYERMQGLEVQVENNSREIASLKEENEQLKEKVESLEARLERLEKLLQ